MELPSLLLRTPVTILTLRTLTLTLLTITAAATTTTTNLYFQDWLTSGN
jgi:hypothetical protein